MCRLLYTEEQLFEGEPSSLQECNIDTADRYYNYRHADISAAEGLIPGS